MVLSILAKLIPLALLLIEDSLVFLGGALGFSFFTVISIIITIYLLWVFVPQFKIFVFSFWRFILLFAVILILVLPQVLGLPFLIIRGLI